MRVGVTVGESVSPRIVSFIPHARGRDTGKRLNHRARLPLGLLFIRQAIPRIGKFSTGQPKL